MKNNKCEAAAYCPVYMMYASQLVEGKTTEVFEILSNHPLYICTAQRAINIPKTSCMIETNQESANLEDLTGSNSATA